MKAVLVDASIVFKWTTPIPLRVGDVRVIHRVRTNPCCGIMVLDVGLVGNVFRTTCRCGNTYDNGGIWWLSAYRFRPLLGDEQEALDTIEQEVKETELIPEPA